MKTELLFQDKKIPVSFIFSDQKAIPQLINLLESKKADSSGLGKYVSDIDRIEIICNEAVLHTSKENDRIQFPLY